ncbi:MAG: hypothetical protein MJ149_02675, partial [Clostridia bacterium]|nr:hypothetical protein [Clostridia bacterium]
MSKIISAEIKKQVSRPGIFILAVLLAVILVLGVLIYKPTETTSNSANIKAKFINDASVVEIYTTFNGDRSTYGLYADAQKEL